MYKKKALCKGRTNYYSLLISENKNNLKFLLSTVARLTQSQFHRDMLAITFGDHFMNFFINRMVNTIKTDISSPTNYGD